MRIKKTSIFKKIYRKFIFHMLIDKFIIPSLSLLMINIKPVFLVIIKPALAFITFISASIIGFMGFMSKLSANEITNLASNEIVKESSSDFLDVIVNFLF